MFFVNKESVLFVAFVKYTFSKLYTHCTQNCNFYYFLATKISFVTKTLFNIFLGLSMSIETIVENHSLKSGWKAYDMLSFGVYSIPSHFYDMICMT